MYQGINKGERDILNVYNAYNAYKLFGSKKDLNSYYFKVSMGFYIFFQRTLFADNSLLVFTFFQ